MATVAQLKLMVDPADRGLLTDVQYQDILDLWPGLLRAASQAATSIAASFAQKILTSVDGVKASEQQMYEHYKNLAHNYAEKASDPTYAPDDGSSSSTTGLIHVTGISVSEMQDEANDTDVYQPAFSRGMMDNGSCGTPGSCDEC